MLSCTFVCWCLVVTCWEKADLLALVFDVLLWRCHFPIGILGQVWCLIVSIPDLCHLSYFKKYLPSALILSVWDLANVIWTTVACGACTQIEGAHNKLKPSLIKIAWIAEPCVSKMTEFHNYQFRSNGYTNELKDCWARLASFYSVVIDSLFIGDPAQRLSDVT